MKLTRNALIFSLVTSILAVGGYAYLFLEVRATAKDHRQLTEEIEMEQQRQERAGSVSSALAETEEAREHLRDAFVTDETFVDFFEEFEVLREEAEVAANVDQVREDIEFETEGEGGDGDSEGDTETSSVADLLGYVELDVSAEGSWEQVFRFLSLIETMPYAMTLQNVRVNQLETPQAPQQQDEGEEAETAPTVPQWDLTFTIRVVKYN